MLLLFVRQPLEFLAISDSSLSDKSRKTCHNSKRGTAACRSCNRRCSARPRLSAPCLDRQDDARRAALQRSLWQPGPNQSDTVSACAFPLLGPGCVSKKQTFLRRHAISSSDLQHSPPVFRQTHRVLKGRHAGWVNPLHARPDRDPTGSSPFQGRRRASDWFFSANLAMKSGTLEVAGWPNFPQKSRWNGSHLR